MRRMKLSLKRGKREREEILVVFSYILWQLEGNLLVERERERACCLYRLVSISYFGRRQVDKKRQQQRFKNLGIWKKKKERDRRVIKTSHTAWRFLSLFVSCCCCWRRRRRRRIFSLVVCQVGLVRKMVGKKRWTEKYREPYWLLLWRATSRL